MIVHTFPKKVVGGYFLIQLQYPHSKNNICDKYPSKENRNDLSGMENTKQEVRRVLCRDHMCIIRKHKYFVDSDLHCIKLWVKIGA